MKKTALLIIRTGSWHTGGIQVNNASTIAVEALPQASTPLELMVHVAEDHEIRSTPARHAIQSQGKVLIAPVDRRGLPIPTTGAVRIGSQTGGTAVRQHHQRLISWDIRCGSHDPISGLFHCDRSEHGFHRLGKLKSTTGTAGACTYNSDLRSGPAST